MPPVGKSGPGMNWMSSATRGRRVHDQVQRRFAELGDVVRRDRGGHAHGDTCRAIGEEVGEVGGEDRRLFGGAIIGRFEIDRVLGHALHHPHGDFGHAGFGVAHGGGAIAVDIAEIALPVDQRVAHGKILRETDQRVVDRLVAMRMERAHHVADDLGGFLVGPIRVEPQQPHAVEDAPVHRLQPVAGIGQRALRDGRQRIGEVALLQRLAQVDDRLVVVIGGKFRRS